MNKNKKSKIFVKSNKTRSLTSFRRSKKAEAIGTVVKAIIAIFIIFVMLWVLPAQITGPVKRFFGLAGNYTSINNELAVTQAQFKETQLKTAANSVNALTCAINSIATGKTPSDEFCEPPYDINSASMTPITTNQNNYNQSIGQAILNCYNDYKATQQQATQKIDNLPCNAINPETTQFTIDKNKIQQYIDAKAKANDQTAKDINGWTINPLSWVGIDRKYEISLTDNTLKTNTILCGRNNKIILTDDPTKCGLTETIPCEGANTRKYGASCVVCQEEQPEICCEYQVTSYAGLQGATNMGKNYDWKTQEECQKYPISKKVEDSKCQTKTSTTISKCQVKGFELPQDIQSQDYADKWIAASGDPAYLLYYETFPQGEDEYWNMDAYSFQPTIMIGAAVFAGLLPTGDISKIANLAKGGGATGIKNAVAEMASQSLVVKTFRGGSSIYSAIKTAQLFAKKTPQQAKKAEEIIQDIITNIKRPTGDQQKAMFRQSDSTKLKEAIESTDPRSSLGQIIKDKGIEGNKRTKLIDDIMEKVNAGLIKESKDQTGTLGTLFRSILRGGRLSDEELAKILTQKGKNIDSVIELLNKNKITRAQLLNALEKAGQKGTAYEDVGEVTISSMGLKPFLETIENTGEKTGFGTKMRSLVSLVPGGGIALTTVGAAAEAARITLATPEGRLATMLGLGWIATMIDSQNEKFRPQGKDAIYLNSPSLMAGADKKIEIPLATQYFIGLKKDPTQKPQRFHAISPCKANMEVTKKSYYTSSNNIDITTYDIYNFGKGTTPVRKGTVLYNLESQPITTCPTQDKIYDYITTDTLTPEPECYGKEIGTQLGGYKECIYTNNFCYKGNAIDRNGFKTDYQKLQTDLQQKLQQQGSIQFDYLMKEIHFLLSSVIDNDYKSYPELTSLKDEITDLQASLIESYIEVPQKFEDILQYTKSPTLQAQGYNTEGTNSEEFRYRITIEENQLKEGSNQLYMKAKECLSKYAECDYEKYMYDFIHSEHKNGATYNWNALDIHFFTLLSADDCRYAADIAKEIPALNDQNAYTFDNPEIINQYITRPVYEHACILSNADGPNLNYAALIPTYMFNEYTAFYQVMRPRIITLQSFNDIIIPELKRLDAYKKEDVPNLESQELIFLKSYLEEKKTVLKENFNTNKGTIESEGDTDIWIETQKELAKRNLVDPTNAVKDMNNFITEPTPAQIINDKLFSFETIEINPTLDQQYQNNYCYHGDFGMLDAAKTTNFVMSLFMDQVVGGLATIGCAATPLAPLAPACNRIAAVATNIGFAYSGQWLNEQTKWPKHGMTYNPSSNTENFEYLGGV